MLPVIAFFVHQSWVLRPSDAFRNYLGQASRKGPNMIRTLALCVGGTVMVYSKYSVLLVWVLGCYFLTAHGRESRRGSTLSSTSRPTPRSRPAEIYRSPRIFHQGRGARVSKTIPPVVFQP